MQGESTQFCLFWTNMIEVNMALSDMRMRLLTSCTNPIGVQHTV